jgi:AraC-like DNA-binding protein
MEVAVRQCLASMIGLEEISLAGVAGKLGMSRRTLIRHLLREHTSFQSILDEVRSSRARHLLARGDASITEIAFALGFGDASVFTRSFRRWTGSSPSAWRSQNRSA